MVERVMEFFGVAVWVLSSLGLAVVALYRFRATAAGLLMGGGFGLLGLKAMVSTALRWLGVLSPSLSTPGGMTRYVISSLISFVCLLVVAAGILAIPSALRAKRAQGH